MYFSKNIILSILIAIVVHLPLNAQIILADDIIELKKHNVGAELIQLMVKKNAIMRALVTVEGIIKMKKEGIKDQFIIDLINTGDPSVDESREEDFLKRKLESKLKRKEKIIEAQQKKMQIIRNDILELISNDNILQLLKEGKLSTDNLVKIIKTLGYNYKNKSNIKKIFIKKDFDNLQNTNVDNLDTIIKLLWIKGNK